MTCASLPRALHQVFCGGDGSGSAPASAGEAATEALVPSSASSIAEQILVDLDMKGGKLPPADRAVSDENDYTETTMNGITSEAFASARRALSVAAAATPKVLPSTCAIAGDATGHATPIAATAHTPPPTPNFWQQHEIDRYYQQQYEQCYQQTYHQHYQLLTSCTPCYDMSYNRPPLCASTVPPPPSTWVYQGLSSWNAPLHPSNGSGSGGCGPRAAPPSWASIERSSPPSGNAAYGAPATAHVATPPGAAYVTPLSTVHGAQPGAVNGAPPGVVYGAPSVGFVPSRAHLYAPPFVQPPTPWPLAPAPYTQMVG